ncbi:hypothetical protein ACF0H5_015585 [Mactra antiquata]
MYPHPILFVLHALFCSVISPTANGKLPDLATLCPYNDFCSTKATKMLPANESELTPCCQKCSCETDCQLFGNCCPDKELTSDVQVKYPCVSIYLYHNKPRFEYIFEQYDVYYHVINDCPTKNLLAEFPRCSELYYLEDYAFVSDPLTDRVYQNKHCARCNGVFNYTQWFLSTDCTSENYVTYDEWLWFLSATCELTPIAPEPSSGHAYRCYPQESKDILKCNSSGELETKDAEIQDACEFDNPKTNSLFYQDASTELTGVYQNPYCKLCNADNGEGWSDVCTPYNATQPSRLKPWNALLNLFNEEKIIKGLLECNQTYFWDPYQKLCITVICPAKSMHIAGICEDLYQRLPEETYNIYFKVDVKFNYLPYLKLKTIHKIISEAISNEDCYHCQTRWMTDRRLNPYILYQIRTQDGCSEDYLIRQLQRMVDTPLLYAGFKDRSFARFSPDLRISKYTLKPSSDVLRNGLCRNPIHLSSRFIDRCPRIPIQYLYLNVSEHKNINIRTETNGTMCVDEYFRIMQSLEINASYSNKKCHWVTVFVAVVAYCAVQI